MTKPWWLRAGNTTRKSGKHKGGRDKWNGLDAKRHTEEKKAVTTLDSIPHKKGKKGSNPYSHARRRV